jgi:hypothetical protein
LIAVDTNLLVYAHRREALRERRELGADPSRGRRYRATTAASAASSPRSMACSASRLS